MSMLRCEDVRLSLRAFRAGRLAQGEASAVREHLASCELCRAEDAADQALTSLLETRAPRPLAPESLQQRLAAMVAGASLAPEPIVAENAPRVSHDVTPAREPEHSSAAPKPTPIARPSRARSGRAWAALGTLAAAALALLVVLRPARPEQSPLLQEVVNDHLRVLYAQQPIEIESGGIHQVKPWFAGRVDFAPRVVVEDDEGFPLRGGAVSYVLDRKAATFVFMRRLHTISLFVFRSDGLPWPELEEQKLGPVPAQVASQRGFNVVMFRQNDLAYALVSDLNLRELTELGTKLAQP